MPDHATLRVIPTLEQRRGHGPVVAQPKTPRSRRHVELGESTAEALRRHWQAWPGIGFAFTRADGRRLSMSIVGKSWARLNERAGVPRLRFHDLRHTAATVMLSRGIHRKVVSKQLGHASIVITLDTYSHVIPTMQREAAKVMAELLAR